MSKNSSRIQLDWILIGLLLVSLALRVVLARQGGQLQWPDESRYQVAQDAVSLLASGQTTNALEAIFSRADHLGFRVIMMLPAIYQLAWRWPNWAIAVLNGGICSVGSIYLIYAIARRLGSGREEARWAALFMATPNSLFYWSQHLVPYDMALCLALAGLFIGAHPKAAWHRSLLAGFFGFCAFVTYNGYWTIVAIGLVVHVALAWPTVPRMLVRAVLGFIGLAGPLLILLHWAATRDYPLIDSYYTFSNSVNQGDYSDGHRIIVEYLWAAEGGLCLVWLAAVGWLAVVVILRKERVDSRAWIGMAGALAVCISLIGLSNFEEKFVVYGRLVRQIVPFVALLSGWMAADVCARHTTQQWLRPSLVFLIVVLAAFNFSTPLTQHWDFYSRAIAYRDQYREDSGRKEADRIPVDRFQLLFPDFLIWPMPPHYELTAYRVLLENRHPMQFKAYLYEGYNKKQRAAILSTDITQRLVLFKK